MAKGIHVQKPTAQPKKANRFIRFLISTKGLLLAVLTCSGLFTFRDEIHKWITPDEQLYREKNFATSGINMSIPVIYNITYLNIKTGSNGITTVLPLESLKNGAAYSPNSVIFPGGCTPFNLLLKIIDDHLYVSTEFKNLDNKYVGKINYQSMEIKNGMSTYYHDGDDNMELLDDEMHVLFNMKYEYPNTVVIKGIFYNR